MNNVLKELKKVKIFYIATIDENKPKVRPFSSVTEFEGNIYICSGRNKTVYKQLKKNPYIEICGMYDQGSWLRIAAKAVEDERIEAEEAMLKDKSGPSQLYKAGDGRFVVFKLEEVEALKFNFYSAPEEIKEHE